MSAAINKEKHDGSRLCATQHWGALEVKHHTSKVVFITAYQYSTRLCVHRLRRYMKNTKVTDVGEPEIMKGHRARGQQGRREAADSTHPNTTSRDPVRITQ